MTVKQQQGEIAATIAQNIREAVKAAFPGIKFRIVHRGYARGIAHVSVYWSKSGPEASVVEALCKQFETPTSSVWYSRSDFR